MRATLVDRPSQRLLAIAHPGAYWLIGGTFSRLFELAKEHGFPSGTAVGLYYDDPRQVPDDQLRSEAALMVPDGFSANVLGVRVFDLPAGQYITATHIGGYDQLGESWGKFFNQAVPELGAKPGSGCFEVYTVSHNAGVATEDLRTELMAPVYPLSIPEP